MANQLINSQLLKGSKFGCEIEMGRIDKQTACKLVYDYFKTTYPNNIDLITYDGYVGGDHSGYACHDHKGRKWQFVDDGSSSGSRGHISCEMVTPPLNYDEINDLQNIARIMRNNGAKSGAGFNAGVHIHVDGVGHTPKSIRNLVNLMASHEQLLIKAIKLTPSRAGWCACVDRNFLTNLNRVRPTTMPQLRTCWYSSHGTSGGRHYDQSRYHMLNLHSLFGDHGTIEFRLFEFNSDCIHAGALKSWVQLCLAMNSYAKIITRCSNVALDLSNEKHAMNCWLKNMGLIGDEFKTARKMLTKNLTGDTAYAKGRPNACDDIDETHLNIAIGLND